MKIKVVSILQFLKFLGLSGNGGLEIYSRSSAPMCKHAEHIREAAALQAVGSMPTLLEVGVACFDVLQLCTIHANYAALIMRLWPSRSAYKVRMVHGE